MLFYGLVKLKKQLESVSWDMLGEEEEHFYTQAGSIWIAWIRLSLLKGGCFWNIHILPSSS